MKGVWCDQAHPSDAGFIHMAEVIAARIQADAQAATRATLLIGVLVALAAVAFAYFYRRRALAAVAA